MAWTAAQLLAWLADVEPRADSMSHFDWLEMKPSASSQAIQNAYHEVARTRHPDLARRALGTRDYDRLVRMYSHVASAYAALRTPDAAASYLRERRDSQKIAAVMTHTPPHGTANTHPPIAAPAAPAPAPPPPPPPPSGPIDPARAMNARALACYRRAEGALRTGDRSTALLQIRMAIAANPRSTLLRAALAELMST